MTENIVVTKHDLLLTKVADDEQAFVREVVAHIEATLNNASFYDLDKDGVLAIRLDKFGPAKFTDSVKQQIKDLYLKAGYAEVEIDEAALGSESGLYIEIKIKEV